MKNTINKLKFLFLLLFKKQFVVIYFPAHEEIEWRSFGLEIEQVGDACDVVAEEIMDIIDDYIACEDADRIGDNLINFVNCN